jgi:DNA processing protein
MQPEHPEMLYQIALSQLTGVGATVAKNLVAYCGSAKSVFETSQTKLTNIPNIGSITAEKVKKTSTEALQFAEKQLQFLAKNPQYCAVSYYDDTENYPTRLRQCADAPIVLFCHKNINLNPTRAIGVVGTRTATDYGKALCNQLCTELTTHNPLIVSGLAYGIDIAAHKAALQHQLPTVAVVAHGLDTLYPSTHAPIAQKMVENGGGIITEFLVGMRPLRENFLQRNRIIAGLVDAVVIVESAAKGGSLVTAHYAAEYNREAFAYPGRTTDATSQGCNDLIKQNKANIITHAADIAWQLNWDLPQNKKQKIAQPPLFLSLTPDQQIIYDALQPQPLHIDTLCRITQFTTTKMALHLLEMELAGIINALPAKVFCCNVR